MEARKWLEIEAWKRWKDERNHRYNQKYDGPSKVVKPWTGLVGLVTETRQYWPKSENRLPWKLKQGAKRNFWSKQDQLWEAFETLWKTMMRLTNEKKVI